MKPLLSRLRQWLASLSDMRKKLSSIARPDAREIQTQMMCPFCGLITPRAKRHCLECGKPLRGISSGPKDAPQG